jgi:hypothetical protein
MAPFLPDPVIASFQNAVAILFSGYKCVNTKCSPRFKEAPPEEEDIPWKCCRLAIGTGAHGALPVMEEVKLRAAQRNIESLIFKTDQAIGALKRNPEPTRCPARDLLKKPSAGAHPHEKGKVVKYPLKHLVVCERDRIGFAIQKWPQHLILPDLPVGRVALHADWMVYRSPKSFPSRSAFKHPKGSIGAAAVTFDPFQEIVFYKSRENEELPIFRLPKRPLKLTLVHAWF